MEFAISLIVGLVVGGAIGALATWWISRARGGAVSVMQLKQENDKFRNEVTDHFVETARLINQMTDSYKQVFDHLSSGAERLVDDKKLAERLPPASGQEVRLGGFGAASPVDSDGHSSSTRTGSDDSTTAHSPSPAGTQQAGKSESEKSESEKSDSAKSDDGKNSSDGPDEKSADRDPLKATSASRPASSGSKEQGAESAAGSSNPASDKSAKDKSASADSKASKSD
ncbi:MAG: DUF1043 family protein [Wenzhouxiangellaceae bacterium]